ncbi:TPA: hypothetical protein HA246_04160 [Candidatus Woesearchaeota archaeon]|nr:hypothetical protein [Candidatus Woesearchaeota archaeon]
MVKKIKLNLDETISMKIGALVRSGMYKNKSEVLIDAIEWLYKKRPELKEHISK